MTVDEGLDAQNTQGSIGHASRGVVLCAHSRPQQGVCWLIAVLFVLALLLRVVTGVGGGQHEVIRAALFFLLLLLKGLFMSPALVGARRAFLALL